MEAGVEKFGNPTSHVLVLVSPLLGKRYKQHKGRSHSRQTLLWSELLGPGVAKEYLWYKNYYSHLHCLLALRFLIKLQEQRA
jgi:hypothetical protein